MAALLHASRRAAITAVPALARQATLIVLALLAAGLVLAIAGYQPLDVAAALWRGITIDIGGILRWATPMTLLGLAAAVAFRAEVWNIGLDGQLFLGAFAAAWVGLQFPELPRLVALPSAIVLSMIVGMAWALLAGLLRVRFGANEIVTTLLLNFVAFYITDWLVLGPYADRGPSSNTFSTARLPETVYLDRIMQGSQANVGLYIAILMVAVIAYLKFRTTIGYELKVVGSNALFAQYGGISIRRVILIAMALSGALAGLTGAIEMLGVHRRFAGRFQEGLGFDGIVVAILARNHPIGILLAGLFFGAFRNGAANMERMTEVPRSMVEIVQAIIVLMVSADFAIRWYRRRQAEQQAQVIAESGDTVEGMPSPPPMDTESAGDGVVS